MASTPALNITPTQDLPHAEFQVTVEEGRSHSQHTVSLSREYLEKLAGGDAGPTEAESLVRRAFEFLLEREPKESILSEFDLSQIQHYFPEFAERMKDTSS